MRQLAERHPSIGRVIGGDALRVNRSREHSYPKGSDTNRQRLIQHCRPHMALPTEPAPLKPSPDVNLEVVGMGCGTSCVLGFVIVFVGLAMAGSMGVRAALKSDALLLTSFLLGRFTDLIVGYVTARAARRKRVPVNLHIFIVGGLALLLGGISLLMTNPQRAALPVQPSGTRLLLGLLGWILVIPMMLLGASWSEEPSEKE